MKYNFDIDLTPIFVKKKNIFERTLLPPEGMNKIVFRSLIAVNEMLTSHCDYLSTYHCHPLYHPCFDMQSSHEQTTQQYFLSVAMPSRKKGRGIELNFF